MESKIGNIGTEFKELSKSQVEMAQYHAIMSKQIDTISNTLDRFRNKHTTIYTGIIVTIVSSIILFLLSMAVYGMFVQEYSKNDKILEIIQNGIRNH